MRCCVLSAATVLLALASAARADDKAAEALKAALGKTTAASGYGFTQEEAGGGPNAQVEAKYEKGQPLWCKAEGLECFKRGEEVAYKQGDEWLRSKRGTLSDPLRVLGAIAKVRGVILPHEELAGFEKNLKDVKKAAKEDGADVYAGDLTDEAAKKLVRPSLREVARGGTAKLWVNGDGVVTKYTITVPVRGRLGNAEIDGTTTRTMTLGGLDKTKVEVPEAAKKALE